MKMHAHVLYVQAASLLVHHAVRLGQMLKYITLRLIPTMQKPATNCSRCKQQFAESIQAAQHQITKTEIHLQQHEANT